MDQDFVHFLHGGSTEGRGGGKGGGVPTPFYEGGGSPNPLAGALYLKGGGGVQRTPRITLFLFSSPLSFTPGVSGGGRGGGPQGLFLGGGPEDLERDQRFGAPAAQHRPPSRDEKLPRHVTRGTSPPCHVGPLASCHVTPSSAGSAASRAAAILLAPRRPPSCPLKASRFSA